MPEPKKEKPRSPEEIEAENHLRHFLEQVTQQIQEQLTRQGYGLSMLSLEIQVNLPRLRGKWRGIIRRAAKGLSFTRIDFIDPYGDGMGSTTTFTLAEPKDVDYFLISRIGGDAKPTGHFADAKKEWPEITVDIDGVNIYKETKKDS